MNIYILSILIFLLAFQGGFYSSSFLLVGMFGTLFLIFSKKKIFITKEIILLSVVAIIYLLSVIVNEISYSALSCGLIPLICLIVVVIFSSMEEGEKNKVFSGLEIMGIASSIIAVFTFIGLFHISGGMNAGRLQFTFQYANVAGTWFAVCFILARDSQRKIVKLLAPVNLLTLLMTKSIGAIIILFILQTIWVIRRALKFRTKKEWGIAIAYFLMSIIATIVVSTRLGQGIYTFIERLIQSYDGLKVIDSHILTGIGAGNWQYVYPFYQSAQYKAGVIHNSYVQIGVSAGIIPMIFMIGLLISVAIKFIRKNDCKTEAAFFILLHSMMDYCLSFVCIDVLLIVLLGFCHSNGNERVISEIENKKIVEIMRNLIEQKTVKISVRMKKAIRISAYFLFLGVFCFGYYGTMQIRTMEQMIGVGNTDEAISIYKNNSAFMKNGYRENELYFQALLMGGENSAVVEKAERCKKKSSQVQYYEVLARELQGKADMECLIRVAEAQPFHYEMLCELTELVKKGNYSEEEFKKYERTLSEINKKIKEKPACWLNNQKEVQ